MNLLNYISNRNLNIFFRALNIRAHFKFMYVNIDSINGL